MRAAQPATGASLPGAAPPLPRSLSGEAARKHDEVQLGVNSNSNASLPAGSLHPLRGAVVPPAKPQQTARAAAPPVWVQRLRLAILVLFCIELGMLLVVLPWHRVWLENALLNGHFGWRALAHNTFLRGAVSGLGLVDIWIGISEAVHYREIKPGN